MRQGKDALSDGIGRDVGGAIAGGLAGRISSRGAASRDEIVIELVRKSIHLLIAFTPLLLSISKPLTLVLLASGIAAFAGFEALRMRGIRIPIISALTEKAARKRDAGRFVKGPITLGLGALLSALLFEPIPASAAIYILAFGDGFSSLVGKLFGRVKMPLTRGKSVEGSLTCFIVSMLSAYAVSGKLGASAAVAAFATIVEALPTKDWDNIILPLAAGLMATLLGL
jgi:dolichol kinase